MFKSKICICFALFMICISHALAENEPPPKESEFTYDSKHRFSCGGYSIIDVASEFEGHIEFYKADSDTLACISGAVFGRCADGQPCKCPPAEWAASECWEVYGAFKKLQHRKTE
jgi:hypothetical protein